MYDIKQYAKLAEKDEDALIQRLMASTKKERNREQNIHQAKVRELKKRMTTVDIAIKQLFEEKIEGNVPQSIFRKLMSDYESEQTKITTDIDEIEMRLQNAASDKFDVAQWINLIKGIIHIDDLDRITAVTLIKQIDVSEQFYENGQRQQNIKITYNFVGIIPEILEKSRSST